MGIGLAAFIDKAGTGPSGNLAKRGGLHGGWESAVVRVHSDGKVTMFAGSHSHGQGHEITFCQIAADRLGLPIDDIQLVEGDTDRIPFGNGTWGARSASVAGTAIYRAADKVVAKATRFAAHMMECAPADVEYRRGVFRVRGTDRSLHFAEVADAAYHGAALPMDGSLDPGLEVTEFYDPPDTNDPQAMHLAVVMVDPETGSVKLRDLYAADDCGVVINPMIVEGQVHGGLAQGVGQALLEHVVYDRELRSASVGKLHGLRHAACFRSSIVSHRVHRDAGPEQSDRREGRQREWSDRRTGGHRQRRDRCAMASWCSRYHLADHIRDHLASAARCQVQQVPSH